MAEAAVSFLLDNLKQLAEHHINLVNNAQKELDLLENDLNMMKGFLQDASKKAKKEEHFKAWEKQIREIVYEVEDTIDMCVAQAAMASKSKNPFKSSSSISLAQAVLSLRRDKIKPVFDKAIVDFANLPIADASEAIAEDPRSKWNKSPRKDNVVGFEDETDTLINLINQDTEKLEVVSIIGMPGLGKTTVAWKIFHDPRIQYEYPTVIWVYVSQEVNKWDVLITILKKLTQEDMTGKPIDELITMVYESLEKGKFLIVMDDVWTEEAWDELQQLLPMSNNMGKVLITSRHERVAWHANKRRPPHKLRFLTKPESWQLLQLEVFGKVDAFPPELEKVGKHIAHQCSGLPLAIIVIGGILVGKFSTTGGHAAMRKEWEKISKESVEAILIYEDQERRVEKMIALSYNKLPYHLRDCFLYLGMFPEDTELLSRKVIQLWIAEGFIQEKSTKSLEEVAHDNLKDLINRNLVMVDEIKPNGEVKTCRLHDTIREFCKNEASSSNQNLFQEIKKSKQNVFQPSLALVPKCRRLCIHSNVDEFLQKKIKLPKARSFLCFSKEPIILTNKDIAPMIEAFNLLRVMDANTIKFPKFPSKVASLVHLRYITLAGDELKVLPDSMSKLWNLQTLIVDTLARTLEVNADIWALIHLRHLKTKASIILSKGKGEGCEHLQTLGRLSPQSCTDEVFKKAQNISTLGIRGDLNKVLSSKILKRLCRVENLKLIHDVFPKVASDNPLPGLLQSDNFPPQLKVLTLSTTFLDWGHMQSVGQIPKLEVLKLKDNAFMGNSWESTPGGFHNLEFLYISRTDLKFWTAKPDAFPTLRSLSLKNCEVLDAIPNLGSKLEMLSIERVPKTVAVSARAIAEQKPETAGIGRFKLVIAPGVE